MAEHGDGLVCVVDAQLEDVEPVAVPVNNHQITVRSEGEEVSTDALEWVSRFFWCCGWHGWVTGGVSGAL